MKIPLSILGLILIVLSVFWIFSPDPEGHLIASRTDLPWQVVSHADGTSTVFDLRLGEASLDDAINKFGFFEALAVFEEKNGARVLEAYFGTVQFGMIKAKVVVRLKAEEMELQRLIEGAKKREGSPTGSWKWVLYTEDANAQRHRRVSVITYIPVYSQLEGDFFLARLGEPDLKKVIDEDAIQWYYPGKGITLLLNSSGKEVLEYTAPKDFIIPES